MQKMFIGYGKCPFTGKDIGTVACSNCEWYFKQGTETFIWCKHPEEPQERKIEPLRVIIAKKEKIDINPKRKRNTTVRKKRTSTKKAK